MRTYGYTKEDINNSRILKLPETREKTYSVVENKNQNDYWQDFVLFSEEGIFYQCWKALIFVISLFSVLLYGYLTVMRSFPHNNVLFLGGNILEVIFLMDFVLNFFKRPECIC